MCLKSIEIFELSRFKIFFKSHFQSFWASRFVLINWKYWINSTFEWEISRYHIESNRTSKHDSLIQLFRLRHIKHQLHVVLICLIRNVEQSQRISTLQKWEKSIHYRNSFEIWKIMLLSNLCSSESLCECFVLWRLSLNFSRCLQNNNAIFIITQCALVRFSMFLILWIVFTSCFKTSLQLYVLLFECKCY